MNHVGVVAGTPVPPVRPALRARADGLSEHISLLEKQVEELEAVVRRLGDRNSDRQGESATDTGRDDRVPVERVMPNHLAYQLEVQNTRMNALNCRLDALMSDLTALI